MKKIILFQLALFFLSGPTNAQDFNEVNITNHPADDRYASYSPDGKSIVFESNRDGNWNIFIMNVAEESVRRITTHDSSDRQPTWHPKGKQILFQSNRSGTTRLYEINTKSGTITELDIDMESSGEVMFASYSPKGKKIAFSYAFNRDHSAVYSIYRNGKGLKQITSNIYRNHFPRWSPDSKSLIFFSRKDTENNDDEIYQYSIKSKEITRLTNWPKHNFCPSYSNDGKQIAYVTSMENSRPEIYIMNSDGNNKKQITFNDFGDTLPTWSRNDDHLLITAYRNDNYEICKINLVHN